MPTLDTQQITQYYELRGDPSDPSVLLIGGLGGVGGQWGPQTARFAERYHVILPDQRGTGLTTHAADGYTTQQLATDMAELVEHLDVGPVHVVGASTGAAIGQYMALEHRRAVRSLTMVGAFARFDAFAHRGSDARRALVLGSDRETRYAGYASYLFSQRYTRAHPEKVQEWIDEIVGHPEPPEDRDITVKRIDMIAAHDALARLGDIEQPSLVICGSHDVAVGAPLSEEIASAMPGSKLVVLQDAGHLVELEEEAKFFQLVSTFIDRQRDEMDVSTAGTSPRTDRPASRRAVVVGGSLVGLCAALGLSRDGWKVTVLERSSTVQDGMGISIDTSLLASVTGADVGALPVVQTGFPATGWMQLWSLLADEIGRRPEVTSRRGVRVTGVRVDDDAGDVLVEVSGEDDVRADVVVGADGHASTVRGFVAPEKSSAVFGGFVLWRGVVDERDIPGGFTDQDLGFAFRGEGGMMLATYGIPGANGDTGSGRRRGVFIWFDSSRVRLLRSTGKVSGDVVRGTLHGPEMTDDAVDELRHEAAAWAPPWRRAIGDALRRREFIGTPVAEYLPTRVTRGSVVIVGDAAHAVGPVTGAGFHNGLLDVEALTHVLRLAAWDQVPNALDEYERRRLQLARELVGESQRWSQSFATSS